MDQGSLDANAQIFHSGYCAARLSKLAFHHNPNPTQSHHSGPQCEFTRPYCCGKTLIQSQTWKTLSLLIKSNVGIIPKIL